MSALTERSRAEEVVRAFPLLAHLPEQKLRSFLSSFSLVTFQPGSFLCRKGSLSPGLLVLVHGTARVYSDSTAGDIPSSHNTHNTLFYTGKRNVISSAMNPRLGTPLEGDFNVERHRLPADGRSAWLQPTAQLHPLTQSQPQPQSQSQQHLRPQSQSQSGSSIQCSLDDDLGSAAAVAEGTPDPRQGFSNARFPSDAPHNDKESNTWTEAAKDAVTEATIQTVTGGVAGSESKEGVLYTLRPGDWFGHPTSASAPPMLFVDVVASSQVTCAFFPQPVILERDPVAHPANSAASSLDQIQIPNPTNSPEFNAIHEDTQPVRHPLYFVPSPEDLNRLLAGKLEEILHLKTLESTHAPVSAQNPGLGGSVSSPDSGLDTRGSAESFLGTTPREMFGYPRVFGGQLIGQALMAATRTVNPSLLAHSLHCYFVRPGDTGAPVEYRVERLRDGASFSVRRVKAYQGTREIFLFTASFHKPEPGLSAAATPRPGIPLPETLLMVEEEEWRLRTTPCLPMAMRRRLAKHPVRPMPVELRHCESVERLAVAQLLREYPHPKATPACIAVPQPQKGTLHQGGTPSPHQAQASAQGRRSEQGGGTLLSEKETWHEPPVQDEGPRFNPELNAWSRDSSQAASRIKPGVDPGFKPELNAWIRARGLSEASDDPRLHRCIIGYFSDFVLLGTSLAAHGLFPANPRKFNMASLDHAMWFHEECRADEWLLYSLSSPWSGHARGMSLGRMFTRDGRLVVSTAQEGLIRPLDAGSSVPSKL